MTDYTDLLARQDAAAIRELQAELLRALEDVVIYREDCVRAEAERDALRADAEAWRNSFALLREGMWEICISTIASGEKYRLRKFVEKDERNFAFTRMLWEFDAAIGAGRAKERT